MFEPFTRLGRAGIRAIHRVAMLGLVLLSVSLVASCERHPVAGHRLLGVWQVDPTADPEFVEMLKSLGVENAANIPSHDSNDPEAELPMQFTFERDGTHIMTGSILGHPLREVAQWKLIQESPEKITIEVTDPKRPPATSMTFVILEPDLIRSETKAGPMFLRRVKK